MRSQFRKENPNRMSIYLKRKGRSREVVGVQGREWMTRQEISQLPYRVKWPSLLFSSNLKLFVRVFSVNYHRINVSI